MENDEPVSLGEFIDHAVREFAATNGGSMATSFVCIVERYDVDGNCILTMVAPDEQPTHRSLGLVSYANEWYRDDAHSEMTMTWAGTTNDDECDE